MKLIIKLGKLDSTDDVAVAGFGGEYDNILTEAEYELEQEDVKQIIPLNYFEETSNLLDIDKTKKERSLETKYY